LPDVLPEAFKHLAGRVLANRWRPSTAAAIRALTWAERGGEAGRALGSRLVIMRL
jgi:hypothetical protein